MHIKSLINKHSVLFVALKNKELLIVMYFLLFILGLSNSTGDNLYNEYRIIQVILLFIIVVWAVFRQQYRIGKSEGLLFIFIAIGSLFWQQALFIVIDLLVVYLLYKSFQLLQYYQLLTKIIVLCSLVLFLLLPVALLDYVNSGTYTANWYPLSWNIRVYDSYFLILSIFATWFYIRDERYKALYLLFLFLAFLAILLDAGRSVTLAYTAFIAVVLFFHKPTRLPFISTYIASWLAYITITYVASFGSSGLRIARESSSGRITLWINGLNCWVQQPIFGCGFYQLEKHPHLSAHPHNLFIQVLTETGLIGFGFLLFVLFDLVRYIRWDIKQNYFVFAALIAIGIDMSLSGIHIYPITQMALLWLFVFLFKNPEFAHVLYLNQRRLPMTQNSNVRKKYLSVFIVLILAIVFGYLFISTSIFLDKMPSTPPRFWGYGYHLL